MKVSELTGALLDYWVARAENVPAEQLEIREIQRSSPPETHCVRKYRSIDPIIGPDLVLVAPSTNWAHGGPIIEHEKLYLRDPDPLSRHVDSNLNNKWMAAKANHDKREYEHQQFGETILLAAMRCYVASKYGDEVPDIPA